LTNFGKPREYVKAKDLMMGQFNGDNVAKQKEYVGCKIEQDAEEGF
jgi:hypothetical protein